MPKINYLNFDLQFYRKTRDEYFVDLKSPVGEPVNPNNFRKSDLLPVKDGAEIPIPASGEAQNRAFDFGEDGDFSAVISRPLTREQAKEVGKRLFTAVFEGEIYMNLRRSIDRANDKDSRLRIRFNLTQTPELAVLPWEYLYDERLNHFYAEDVRTPIVRYLNQNQPIKEILVNDTLRVLVVVSKPSNLEPLSVEAEWESIKTALKKFHEQKLVEFEQLEKATFKDLERKLALQPLDKPFHVFHFIGHSAFDRRAEEGKMFFENAEGKADGIKSEKLSVVLKNTPALRLVILNTCEGASLSELDSYSGTAQTLLLEANVPAVIAMQYQITDSAALEFSERFYEMLAGSHPIDSALSSARLAISSGNETEWATPVLYMRSDSGELINPQISLGGSRTQAPIIFKTEDNPHYEKVISAILEGKLVPFIGLDANLFGRAEIADWKPGEVLPSSQELARYLAAKFHYPSGENPDLISVSQYAAVKEKGTGELYNCLSDIFGQGYEPSVLHNFWAKVPEILKKSLAGRGGDPLRRRFIVVTTNYDCLLEKAFESQVPIYHVITYGTPGEQIGKFYHAKFAGSQIVGKFVEVNQTDFEVNQTDPDANSNYEPVILKLPGAFERFERRFAITEDHYSDFLTAPDLSGLLPAIVRSKLKASCHLFFGSSLRNWYLRALLYRIWEKRKPNSPSWVIHPAPSEIDKQFWEYSDVDVIVENFDVYVSQLEQRLQNV